MMTTISYQWNNHKKDVKFSFSNPLLRWFNSGKVKGVCRSMLKKYNVFRVHLKQNNLVVGLCATYNIGDWLQVFISRIIVGAGGKTHMQKPR